MFLRILLMIGLFFEFSFSLKSQTLSVSSPGKINSVSFTLENEMPFYSVKRFGRDIIIDSRMGFELSEENNLKENFSISSTSESYFDETWTQPWGEKKYIRNNYNELKIELLEKSSNYKMNIVFRVFDDGIGFRYEFPNQNDLRYFEIMNELTEFNLTGNHNSWSIPAYWWNRYEYLYREMPLSELDTVHTPVTFETKNGLFISIHEAALTDFSSMTLARTDEFKLEADLVPWSDGIKAKIKTPSVTPWRTIQIADNAGELIASYLILNLNEPNKLVDVSWIKPGKYVGIWWEMHIDKSTWGSGPKHGATTEKTKQYIDFASKYGFDGVLVEGWNIGWDGDWIANAEKFRFTESYNDFDIMEVVRYGNEKGVKLIGHHETFGGVLNYEKQMADAYKYYSDLGVNTIKTGYVGHGQGIRRVDDNGDNQYEWHHGQFMVRHYRKAVTEAAKNTIMIDAHEPIKATGIRRTYPNMMTREGARGQEFNAWSSDGGNPPEHTVILPFTRLLSGPMDYTPGIFNLHLGEDRPDNRVNSTLAKQLALYVILYSPLHMAADLPENYDANIEPFQFIFDVPTDWEDTKVLHASIGNYITIVRKDRNSDDWYLGSITDEEGRMLETSLSFLENDKKYFAEIYRDDNDTDWETNPYAMKIEKIEVDKNSILNLRLAPGGGQAIRFSTND